MGIISRILSIFGYEKKVVEVVETVVEPVVEVVKVVKKVVKPKPEMSASMPGRRFFKAGEIEKYMINKRIVADGGDWMHPKTIPNKLMWALFETPSESQVPNDIKDFYISRVQATYNDLFKNPEIAAETLDDADRYDGRDSFIGFAVWRPL